MLTRPVGSSMTRSGRLSQIDFLRFLAAMMVLVYHYAFRGHAADGKSVMPYPALEEVAKYGYLGVDLFFLISGFVILMSASGGSPRRFLISRLVRLYPAFWVCCTTTFLVIIAFGAGRFSATWGQYTANMTMLSGFWGVPSIDSVYWSLRVEMKFYFLVILVLGLSLLRYVEILAGVWLLSSAIISRWHVPYVAVFLIPEYCPYFVGGATLYLIYRDGLSPFRVFIVAASYVFAVWNALKESVGQGIHYGTHLNSIVIAGALLAFYGIMVLIATKRAGWMESGAWLTLGALTYPLYLIHQNVGYVIINATYPRINSHLVLALVTGLMLGFACLVNRGVERRYSGRAKQLLERWLPGTPDVERDRA